MKPDGESQLLRGLSLVMTCLANQGSQSRIRSSPYSYPTSSILISTSCNFARASALHPWIQIKWLFKPHIASLSFNIEKLLWYKLQYRKVALIYSCIVHGSHRPTSLMWTHLQILPRQEQGFNPWMTMSLFYAKKIRFKQGKAHIRFPTVCTSFGLPPIQVHLQLNIQVLGRVCITNPVTTEKICDRLATSNVLMKICHNWQLALSCMVFHTSLSLLLLGVKVYIAHYSISAYSLLIWSCEKGLPEHQGKIPLFVLG